MLELGRESPRIHEDHRWSRRRFGHANSGTYRCLLFLQNDRHPGRSDFVCG